MPVSQLRGRAAELWRQSPQEWFPLSENKRLIRIPKRPFVKRTMAKKSVKKSVARRYNRAVKAAWKEMVRGAR